MRVKSFVDKRAARFGSLKSAKRQVASGFYTKEEKGNTVGVASNQGCRDVFPHCHTLPINQFRQPLKGDFNQGEGITENRSRRVLNKFAFIHLHLVFLRVNHYSSNDNEYKNYTLVVV